MSVAVGSFSDFVGDQFTLSADFCKFAAHQTFDGKDGVFGVGHSLTFGGLTDQTFTAFGESDDGRGGAVAFCVGDDFVLAVIHHSHTAVGGAEVDTDNFAHNQFLLDCVRNFRKFLFFVLHQQQ